MATKHDANHPKYLFIGLLRKMLIPVKSKADGRHNYPNTRFRILGQSTLYAMEHYIKALKKTAISDIAEVGGKNASLGEMLNHLAPLGVNIPDGFAITVSAYKYFINHNALEPQLKNLIDSLDKNNFSNLATIGKSARDLILRAEYPSDLAEAIVAGYQLHFAGNTEVAVRSSATAEDLADASFAGQHDSFLNVKGDEALLAAVKKCFASLYTDRAIKYREDKGFDHNKVFLSVGVQQMIRADIASSGIGFTLEPESGFRDVIHLAGTWGLGENIVQGLVTPDEFLVFKPTLRKGLRAIVQRNLGSKSTMMVYDTSTSGTGTKNKTTPVSMRDQFILSDAEIYQLANWALEIESHYKKPMDFEWAKNGIDNKLYIIQARPETVHSQQKNLQLTSYAIAKKGKPIVSGQAIGSKIVSGRARILKSPKESGKLQTGDILITEVTSPDWDPILKKVSGIVTNKGGRTSHASIVARELGVPAIVGTTNSSGILNDGDLITVSCAEGKEGHVYSGKLDWTETVTDFSEIKLPGSPKVQLIAAEPEKAFELSFYPNDGVGLLRLEFIISNYVKIHPMAMAQFEKVGDPLVREKIESLTRTYTTKSAYFIEKLAEGFATIAAAFYPKEVIVRMSDFKSNEYANLIGGECFEVKEENPMIGFRGASRYYHERYREGFRLECEAMKVVRNEMGLTNVKLMIPFCRTPEEGKKVLALMKEYGLEQGQNALEVFVMAEIPSNVLQSDEFAALFDGFSIGSNDLTQLTLGIDRDSALVADLFDEQNAASRQLIAMMIEKAKSRHKKIGICGQAPSDSAEFAQMLLRCGIDSISFNADALLNGIAILNCTAKATI